MKFLKDNSVRSIIIIGVIFLALPFLIPQSLTQTTEAKGDAARTSDEELPLITKNPMSKFIDRVAGFYGFKKNKRSNGLDKINDMVRQKSASFMRNSDDKEGSSDVASLVAALSDESASGIRNEATHLSSVAGTASSAASGSLSKKHHNNNEGAIQINGKNYEVLKDPAGKKYVLTEKGPIPFDRAIEYFVDERARTGSKGAVNYDPAYASAEGGNPYAANMATRAGSAGNYAMSSSKRGGGSGFGGGGVGGSGSRSSVKSFGEDGSGLGAKFDKINRGAGARPSRGGGSVSGGSSAPSSAGQASQPAANYYAANSYTNTNTGGNTGTGGNVRNAQSFPGIAAEVEMLRKDASVGEEYSVSGFAMAAVEAQNNNAAPNANAATPAPAPVESMVTFGGASTPAVMPSETASMVEDPAKPQGESTAEVKKIYFSNGDAAVIPASDKLRAAMSEKLLRKGAKFEGALIEHGKLSNNTSDISNPWVMPNDIRNKQGDIAPGLAFFSSNKDVLLGNGVESAGSPATWATADVVYNNASKNIKKDRSSMEPLNLVVADVVGQNVVLGVKPDSYYYKVSENLVGGNVNNIAVNGARIADIDPNRTLFIAVDEKTATEIKQKNKKFKVSVMEVTPSGLESFCGSVNNNISTLKKEQAKDRKDANERNIITEARTVRPMGD